MLYLYLYPAVTSYIDQLYQVKTNTVMTLKVCGDNHQQEAPELLTVSGAQLKYCLLKDGFWPCFCGLIYPSHFSKTWLNFIYISRSLCTCFLHLFYETAKSLQGFIFFPLVIESGFCFWKVTEFLTESFAFLAKERQHYLQVKCICFKFVVIQIF